MGGGLRGEDDELGRRVLGEGEHGLHGTGHGGREGRGQVLVQGRMPDACGDRRDLSPPHCWGSAPTQLPPNPAPTVGVSPHPDGGAAGAGQPVRVRRVGVGSGVPPELPRGQG